MTEPRPSVLPPATDESLPLQLTFEEMVEARRQGLATAFSPTVQHVTRYHEAWWIVYERGWLRVTDDVVASELDAKTKDLH